MARGHSRPEIAGALALAVFAWYCVTTVGSDVSARAISPEAGAVTTDALASETPYKIALIVQNHAPSGAQIPIQTLTDALAAELSGRGFCIINPYNAVGTGQNRTATGEDTPEVSALELARRLGADGFASASVAEFQEKTFGAPPGFHRFSVRVSLNLADSGTGAVVCGASVNRESPTYTARQVAANRSVYLDELLHDAAGECAGKLLTDPAVSAWRPQPPPPSPPQGSPELVISDIDTAVQRSFGAMRANPVFRSHYDAAQAALGRAPLAIVGGIVDLTGGKSPSLALPDLLAAAGQGLRMAFVNSGLFEAKDDALVSAITQRIVESGRSPLEDGELMAALKQHGSPDFYAVGDMLYFVEGAEGKYRLRIALHDMHTGKIVWEGAETIVKPLAK